MRVIWKILGAVGVALLGACGGGGDTSSNAGSGTSSPVAPQLVAVTTPDFEDYTTDHTGFNRVRRGYATSGDAAVIAAFEDADPSDPAGYRNLIALSEAQYAGAVTIEVLAEVAGSGSAETVTRILRLTADQTPFVNTKDGQLVTATGKFYLRGQNFVWASINGEAIRGGSDSDGLVNLVLDFDNQTASINLRTGVTGTSDLRSEILAQNLPFNIASGAYGGAITVQVWDNDSSLIYDIDGSLRGNIGGSAVYDNGTHGMTTSGVYTAQGVVDGTAVAVDGVFVGTDPNALP
jgi:hypothetical protein